jgi:hypothetical protein
MELEKEKKDKMKERPDYTVGKIMLSKPST